MNDDLYELYAYLRSYQNYFYTWEEYGNVLAIPGGHTIAYAAQAREILFALKPAGGPKLASLLLVMMAMGPDAPQMLDESERIILKAAPWRMPGQSETFIADGFALLRMLSHLPADLKTGPGRIQVIQTLFLKSHNMVSVQKMDQILEAWDDGHADPERLEASHPLNESIVRSHLMPLAYKYRQFPTVQSLLDAILGLPDLPEKSIVPETNIAERPKPDELLEDVLSNPETFAVGALVRRIWSGLRIPLHSSQPSEQPLGGISDISNKGPLDRMLLSEFAHDDLQFLSRFANGEALYLQRETPPEQEHRERIILVDVSLQSWGTPRTLAYAIMLAIAAHPKTDIPCTAYAVGKSWKQIRFASSSELAASLLLLETAADPGIGLELFFANHTFTPDQEAIIVCAPQSFRQPLVQAVIARHLRRIHYCITAGADGGIRVMKRKPGGLAAFQEFTLPLSELWKKPPAGTKHKKKSPPGIPASGSRRHPRMVAGDYPLLFPYPLRCAAVLKTAEGPEYVVTRTGCVMALFPHYGQYQQLQRGGWMLFEGLPTDDCLYRIGSNGEGAVILSVYAPSQQRLLLLNLSSRVYAETRVEVFVTRRARQATFDAYEGACLIRSASGNWIYSLDESGAEPGIRLEQLETIDMTRIQAQEKPSAGHRPPGPAPRKLREVSITAESRLSFDARWLNYFGHEYHSPSLIIGSGRTGAGIIRSTSPAPGHFVFPDGSEIVHNENGMLILNSSAAEIPPIYLTYVLDTALGAATGDVFAGQEYFQLPHLPRQQTITMAEFHDRYIMPFITEILRFGDQTTN